jgi:uncharacterized protein (TIGR02284 family)
VTQTQEKAVDVLNSFLRGEISAVETYRQALEKVTEPNLQTPLQDCLKSHTTRVSVLTEQIRALGGAPSDGSGVWGTFAKAVEGGAKAFGAKSAITALEEGEDHGRSDYRKDIDKLDTSSKQVVQQRVIPEQERTHDTMSRLKHSLS